jgi:hypothetical protein
MVVLKGIFYQDPTQDKNLVSTIYSDHSGNNPVAAARCTYKGIASGLLNPLQEFKQHDRTVSSDARPQLVAPDDQ